MALDLVQLTSYFINTGQMQAKEFITNYDPDYMDYDYLHSKSPVYKRYPITTCASITGKINNCEFYVKVVIDSEAFYYCAKC